MRPEFISSLPCEYRKEVLEQSPITLKAQLNHICILINC